MRERERERGKEREREGERERELLPPDSLPSDIAYREGVKGVLVCLCVCGDGSFASHGYAVVRLNKVPLLELVEDL